MNLNGNYSLDDVKLDNDEITFDTWIDKYKPIPNGITKHPNGNDFESFETYGEEANFVAEQDHHYVWTEVQGDFSMLLVPGMSYVNRLSYFVTRVPWTNENETVVISMDIECHCYDEAEEEGEGDPDCPDCEGYGFRTVYPDDAEVKLYHEENA
jgi:hypothetical protein